MTDKEKNIKDYLNKLVVDSFRDLMLNGNIKIIEKEKENPLVPTIHIQFYYNKRTNKAFIEYKLSNKAQFLYTEEKFSNIFVNKIQNNLKYNIDVWPEIILPEDGRNERCDLNYNISPFTITYWKSLTGIYMFIEDNIEVVMDAESFIRPHGDYKPDKNFEDFISEVKSIQLKYQQTYLTDLEKISYINDAMVISTEYSPTSEKYIEAMGELNQKYNIMVGNHKVPEIFDDYKEVYKKYMNKDIKALDDNDIINYYLEIY